MVANIIDRYSSMSVNVGFCPYLSVNVLINMNRHSFLLSVAKIQFWNPTCQVFQGLFWDFVDNHRKCFFCFHWQKYNLENEKSSIRRYFFGFFEKRTKNILQKIRSIQPADYQHQFLTFPPDF